MALRYRWLAVGLISLVFCLASALEAAGQRLVEIRYDFGSPDARRLEIWVDCVRQENHLDRCGSDSGKEAEYHALEDDATKKKVAAEAYGFELRSTDTVMLIMTWTGSETADVQYAVTGSDIDAEAIDRLKKLFGGVSPSSTIGGDTTVLGRSVQTRIQPVTDELVASGKLTVTYGKVGQDDKLVETSGPLTFRIRAERRLVTVSNGIVVTTAPEPTVAIIKTSNLISFEKNGTAQQAYEQMITLRGADGAMQPIQSLVTFVNFRLFWSVYASVGFQLNQRLFEEPILGITWRHARGNIGLNSTVGMLFSRETEIIPNTGFERDQRINPTGGLTVDDIPTQMLYHPRLALGFSLDF